MKYSVRSTLVKSLLIVAPMHGGLGCAQPVSHTETDKPGLFGGRKHEETTVYKNPDGTTSTEKEKSTTNDNR